MTPRDILTIIGYSAEQLMSQYNAYLGKSVAISTCYAIIINLDVIYLVLLYFELKIKCLSNFYELSPFLQLNFIIQICSQKKVKFLN